MIQQLSLLLCSETWGPVRTLMSDILCGVEEDGE